MTKYTVNVPVKPNRCLAMFFNKSTGAFLGRTPLDWGRLLIFYIAFYGLLGALFFGQLTVVMKYVITDDVPYRTGEDSLLGLNPGLAAWPKLEPSSASLKFSTNKSSALYETYVETRMSALDEYVNNTSKSLVDCDFGNYTKSVDDIHRPCRFERSLLGDCADPEAEIDRGNVCIYWKMNRVYGYIPDIQNTSFADTILLKCGSQSKLDTENLGEPVYHPSIIAGDGKSYGKFSHAFFPFINQPDYQNQLVAVQFPNITKNVVIPIKCTLINLNKESKPGLVELFVATA